MSQTPTGISLDTAIRQGIEAIRAKKGGLWSQVLILTDNVTSFADTERSYISSLFGASGGDVDTFLEGQGYPDKDEEKLSRRDSEVAALQDAWDWLTAHDQVQSVLVVLLCNIGPCNACKQRLANFRAECVPYYGTNLTVQAIYGQSGGPANETTRGDKKI